jgi:DUF1680 family protein
LLLTAGLAAGAADSPLGAVPFTAVKLADTVWAPRLERNSTVTVAHLLRELEKQGSLGGFRYLAGDRAQAYRGYIWGDSDVYKTLEGIAYSLQHRPDPALAQRLEEIVATIARAQAPDGYLFPHLQIAEPKYDHFKDETTRTCESYSMGHLIESAIAHHQLTGRKNYQDVATKAADLLARVHEGGKLLQNGGHPEIELALVKLHEVTGNRRYLDLATSLVRNTQRLATLWSNRRPAFGHDEAHGHAVAMLYLYSAATDIGRLTGDRDLLERVGRKWTNVVGRKLYVTGGLGHVRHSEGFAPDYDLPNDIAYCETCAAIANVFWQHRLFLTHGDAAYVDVLERSLYNNVLAGVSLTGDRFFYVNPLATDGIRKFNHGLAERFPWTGCPCCPVNVVRLLPRVADYFYAVQGDALYVNLFAANSVRLAIAGGELRLRQQTRYPWDGQVRIEVEAAPAAPVSIHVRVPGWAKGHPLPTDLYRYAESAPDSQPASDGGKTPARNRAAQPALSVNGQSVPVAENGGYAVVRREWRAGDVVEWNLPMPVRRVLAHAKVAADTGRVAVERGPLVYCAEGVDHGGQALNLVLPDGAALTADAQPNLLGGVTVIRGQGQRVTRDARGVRHAEQVALTLVPYAAWNHRGVGPMAVWLPRTASDVAAPYDTSSWVGSNYTPAYAANQVQMWHEFQLAAIERELAAARRHLGLNTLRVYLHYLVYDAEKEQFLQRMEAFLSICDRHGIKPGFTFFDDCWNHKGVTLQTEPPVDGRHNGRWAAVQDADRKDENLPKFKAYVQDVVRAHREDPRVLWWETYNEPNLKDPFTVKLREQAYGWAKETRPQQPVIACWDDHAFTDIVNAHNYTDDFGDGWNRQADLNPAKGTVFTEAGARWYAKKARSNGSPIEVIHWLRSRRAAGRTVPGVYLCWELMVGNSHCRWFWGTSDGAAEPAIPWCGLLWPDGTPVSYAEAEAIRRYTTGEQRAWLLEDFQSLIEPQPPGWTQYPSGGGSGSKCLKLSGSQKSVTGDSKWSDYLLEATVMLKEPQGNAGLIFRVNDPGPGADQMRGYYVGFDTKTLYLGKMNNGWRSLATLDLTGRPNLVALDSWNLLRVAVEGARIRVWFNPLHDDTRPVFDMQDDAGPVRAGAVGVRTYQTSAWFDDVAVLPVSVLRD